ncbi:MAG TPA: glycosyltransferase [Gaiellaceae bacterium]|nr:glycosyltransferase [Gaiellaceae bacterium]
MLARALAESFDVVVLAGGELPPSFAPPPQVEIVPLPHLAGDELHVRRRRADLVLEALRRSRPAVVVVELFPFGRKKLAPELLPLLAEARSGGAVTVCSVRDILVRGRSDQLEHDERAAAVANAQLDAVVVHADPRFVRLEETFRPRTPFRVPVHYSGFVVPSPPLPPAPRVRSGPLVVSAGGGRFGGELLRAAAAAQPLLTARTGTPVKLVAGPFLPDSERRALAAEVRGRDGLELVDEVSDLAAELVDARMSLSQCGYNTALDLLRSRVPALVVPFAAPGEDEQTRRARLLERLGAVRVVSGRELEPAAFARIAAAIRAPVPVEVDLDGAARTREILVRLAGARARGAA